MLLIFPLLPLDTLIATRGVSRRWRALVPAASLCPLRRRYLEFFQKLVHSPAFGAAATRVRPHLRKFDREDYLAALADTGSAAVPEEFALWVREWPERAVYGWMWPGLDLEGTTESGRSGKANARREDALQWMPGSWSVPVSVNPPYVKCVTFSGGTSPLDGTILHATKILPAQLAGLGLLRDSTGSDAGEEEQTSIEVTVLCLGDGRVYILDGKRGGEDLAGIVYIVRGSYTMQREKIIAKSWPEFLEKDLEVALERLRALSTQGTRDLAGVLWCIR